MTLTQRHHGACAAGRALLTLLLTAAPAAAQGAAADVFTSSNDANANSVLAFQRDPSGHLVPSGTYATGGAGTGTGLGNQGAVTLDRSGRRLLVVDAGSDTVSVFGVGPHGLRLLDTADSGGAQPISVTLHGDLVYVLNEGGDGNVAGLRLSPHGRLSPIDGSSRPLSVQGPDPAQVAFTSDGRFLVVSEKDTNTLVTYRVGVDGLAGDPVANASAGVTPFGFSFDNRSRLLVSEAAGGSAGASTVSSYDLQADGSLAPITSALATTQSAACWLIATKNGRHAFVTNTGSDTITGLAIGHDGSLTLLDPTGVSAPAGDAPIDAALSRSGRFLHVLNGSDDTISTYRVGPNGHLAPVETLGPLPPAVNGLAAL